MSKLIATFGLVGMIPFAPGTFGSLAALPFGWALAIWAGPVGLLCVTVLVFFAGLWATGVETAGAANHDPSEIVIDEVAGQFLALLPLSVGVLLTGNVGVTLVAGFILFRLFDILKPFPVSWADNMNTPMGVMLDDVLAGLLAALCLLGLAWIFP